MKKWPDFLGKEEKDSYESLSVLGLIYRKIETDKYYEDCLNKEHKFSIRYEYQINPKLFKAFFEKKEKTIPCLLSMFTDIVKPMTDEIRKLMEDNNLMNEAELFSSDLSFRSHNSKKGVMIGDESKKNEDVVQEVTAELKRLTKEYKGKLKNLEQAIDIKAIAIYIACYYNHLSTKL